MSRRDDEECDGVYRATRRGWVKVNGEEGVGRRPRETDAGGGDGWGV